LLMKQILETATQGDLWLADRNFCTSAILCGFTKIYTSKATYVMLMA
jgi:hypothetical protein